MLVRDDYRCRVRGPRCTGDATEVDHVVPVDAGGEPFDEDNLRSSCGACNRWRAARAKNAEGWRRSPTRIVLVVGPPGAGKSTLAAAEASPADVTIDYDRLAEALGGGQHTTKKHAAANAARNAVLRQVQRGEIDAERVWIVSANPAAEQQFPHHELRVVDPGREEVVRRARAAGRPDEWVELIDAWYRDRRPSTAVVPGSREW